MIRDRTYVSPPAGPIEHISATTSQRLPAGGPRAAWLRGYVREIKYHGLKGGDDEERLGESAITPSDVYEAPTTQEGITRQQVRGKGPSEVRHRLVEQLGVP
jgi:hypothetical protein